VEKEKEIVKLTNVLRRIARSADFAAWNHQRADAAAFCVAQYNRVLGRISEIEPQVAPLFARLSENASPQVVRMAARELAAWFEDEPRRERHRHGCGARVYVGWSPSGGWCR
jgi:hypothetical protein